MVENDIEIKCKVVLELSAYTNKEYLDRYYDGEDLELAVSENIESCLSYEENMDMYVDSMEFIEIKTI